jgi:phosphoribosylformylglycinamidine synthase
MNFGNPEKPRIMGQFVGAIKGIGAAVEALDMPIVSGNVSLYNETDGRAILPTPTIGAVGLIGSPEEVIGSEVSEGQIALVLGAGRGHLGQSALLASLFGRAEGPVPPVDLSAERAHGDFIRAQRAQIAACTDLSDGGLALAAFELAEASGLGVTLEAGDLPALFGEDQARYLVACSEVQAQALEAAAEAAGLPLARVGQFGGSEVRFGESAAPLGELSDLYRSSFERTFG